MALRTLVVLAVLLSWTAFSYTTKLRSNIRKVRRSKLPYLVTPISPTNPFWLITGTLWVPFIKLLPKAWWEQWMFIMLPEWSYRNKYAPFERLGENFFVVAFDKITLLTCDAEVTHQITMRKEHFPKPTEAYKILELFGSNVVTVEGPRWRMHRKTTAASFNEKNAVYTFVEAINQAQGMLSKWFPDETVESTETMRTLEQDTMTLALNIIGYVGFGLRFLWPHQKAPEGADPKVLKYGSWEPPPGFSLGFVKSVSALLHNLLQLLLVPWPILKRLPFDSSKTGWEGKENWVKYMDDFLQDKIAEVRNGERQKEGMDIMGELVRAKYGGSKDGAWMTDVNIIGNAFVMFVAGHETTGNTLHFTMLELANNPASQRQLQQDIDRILGRDSDPATWDYDGKLNAMMASHLGACMNETLRMIPPVVEIPKRATKESDQIITIQGRKTTLPAGTQISIVAVASQRNPNYWPTKPSQISRAPTDLDDYVPERWFRDSRTPGQDAIVEEDPDEENFDLYGGKSTKGSLFRPVRGSYVPFSVGPRSCLGQRIAQVELLATLAVVFQKYSVELAVDEWATDEEVKKMGLAEKQALYARAQAKSRETIQEATSVLTLKLNGGRHVPVRVVKRGKERFVSQMGA